MFYQQLNNFRVTMSGCQVKRCVRHSASNAIHICSVTQAELHQVHVTFASRQIERRVVLAITFVKISRRIRQLRGS